MTSTPEAVIPSLLNTHLSALTLSPVLPVAWPNIPFDPPASYLEVSYFPNTVTRQFIADGEEYRHEGLYQITVIAPSGKGEIGPLNIAGLIAAHFDDATVLVSTDPALTVRVTARPYIAAPIREAAYLRVPITIRWRAFF